ncbi:MAG: SigB/SigF/SigG family RNA polymerase sigma factor [Clostridiales bacterium]|nr:SigB/SigF/SigG family RNA polymerase sigma factor [Clostridiales bacterium]
MIHKVEVSSVNTSQLPVLKNSEMLILFEKIKNGSEYERASAREELINGNLKLVLSVIKNFSSRNENADDLFQIGCIGLIKAIDNFDTSLGVKFSTYAFPMIVGEIRRHLRDNNPIRVSRSLRDIAYKILQYKNENSESFDLDEIAEKIDVKREDLVLAMEAMQDTVSLSEPMYNDNGDAAYLSDYVSDETDYEAVILDRIALRKAYSSLGEREKKILLMRFFTDKTQTEIASEIGISQAQVSRLEKAAIKSLKDQL